MKKVIGIVAIGLIIAVAFCVAPVPTDTTNAVLADGTEITMRISAWQITGQDCAYQVKFSYSGGHGSKGSMYACVPWLDIDATASQYRSAAIDKMVAMIVEHEAFMEQVDARNDLFDTLKRFRGNVGQVTLR